MCCAPKRIFDAAAAFKLRGQRFRKAKAVEPVGKVKDIVKAADSQCCQPLYFCSADTRKYFRAVQLNYLDITSSMGV